MLNLWPPDSSIYAHAACLHAYKRMHIRKDLCIHEDDLCELVVYVNPVVY